MHQIRLAPRVLRPSAAAHDARQTPSRMGRGTPSPHTPPPRCLRRLVCPSNLFFVPGRLVVVCDLLIWHQQRLIRRDICAQGTLIIGQFSLQFFADSSGRLNSWNRQAEL